MNRPIRFIGVTGPAVAGKDTVADIVCELFDAENLSTGDALRAIARHVYRLPPDHMPSRDHLFTVGTFIRSEIDKAFTVKLSIEQARLLNIPQVVISGMRTLPEAQAIQQEGGIVVAVTADQEVRYKRIRERARDAEAAHTFEEFKERDDRENRGVDGNGITAIIEHADVIIENNGSSLEELKERIRTVLTPLLH